MNKFGDRLKNARKLKGLTQKELADMINAKHNSVSNWENNHNKPDPDTIELLCGVLDVSPNYLLGVSSPEILNDEVILLNQCSSSTRPEKESCCILWIGSFCESGLRKNCRPGRHRLFSSKRLC